AIRRWERIGLSGRGIDPGKSVARHSTDKSERAAYQNRAIGLRRDYNNPAVRVRGERIGQAGHGFEAGDARARLATDVQEIAAHQNLTVRLQRNRPDITARVRI